jgi:hypothetical protein
MELGLAKTVLFVSDCCLLPTACCLFFQRLERSVSFDKAQDERMIEPVMVSLPNH